MTQLFLRPSADVSDGNWTDAAGGTTLYASLDETSLDDADYIKSGINPVADICKLELSNPSGDWEEPVTLRFRFRKDNTAEAGIAFTLLQNNYPTTFDPANKTANTTLSGGGLIATITAVGDNGVRSIVGASAGKKFLECAMTTTTGSAGDRIFGISNDSLPVGQGPGFDLDSIGVNGDGVVKLNGSTVATVSAFVQGDTLGLAIDFDNEKIWFRTNGGDWNDDVIGNENPATNTGGISFSSLNAGPYYFVFYVSGNGSVFTLNTGATDYAFTPPSGFVNLGVETEISSWNYEDIADTFVTEEETLTTPQFEAITNPDDLRISFEANWSALLALFDYVNGLWLGEPYAGSSPIQTGATYAIDANGEYIALIFKAPKTGNLDRFDAMVGITNSPDNGLRFSFQTVDASTGLPTGTILGATNNALVTYAHTVTAGWKSTNFGEVASVTKGDVIACVVDIPSYTVSDNIQILRTGYGTNRVPIFPYGISNAAAKEPTYLPIISPHYTDGYFQVSSHYMHGADTIAQATMNTGTSPDEAGMAFTVPGACEVRAFQIEMSVAAGANFEVRLLDTDGTTEITKATFDGDQTGQTAEGQVCGVFDGAGILPTAGTYRIVVKPTTANSVALRYWTFQSLALMDTLPGGSSMYMTARTDTGSWTDYNSGTFRRPAIAIQLKA